MIRPLVAILLAVSLHAAAAPTENVIHMKGGRVARGEVVRTTTDEVVLRTRYGEISIARSDITSIEGPELPAPTEPPPTPPPTPTSTPTASTEPKAEPTPAATPASSSARILRLQDGSTVRGEILRTTNEGVVVRTAYGELTVPISSIRSMDVDTGSPASTPAPAAPPKPAATPWPTPRRIIDDEPDLPERNGLVLAASAGFQSPRGRHYDNDFRPGPALKFDIGWRKPWFAIETGYDAGWGSVDGGDDVNARYVHFLNVDVRVFPWGPAGVEPNFLAGYSLYSAVTVDAGSFGITYTGYSPILGAGVRFHSSQNVFLAMDFRYLYTRYTRARIKGGDVFDTTSQLHGDTAQFLFGVGAEL